MFRTKCLIYDNQSVYRGDVGPTTCFQQRGVAMLQVRRATSVFGDIAMCFDCDDKCVSRPNNVVAIGNVCIVQGEAYSK